MYQKTKAESYVIFYYKFDFTWQLQVGIQTQNKGVHAKLKTEFIEELDRN